MKNISAHYIINAAYLTFPQISAGLVALMTLPVILKSLDVADYGKFQFILALEVWLVALTGSHISSGAIKGISRGQDGTFIYSFLVRFKLLFIIAILGVIASIYLYFTHQTTFAVLLLILALFLAFGYLFQLTYPIYLIAKKQFKFMVTYQIMANIFSAVISAIVAYYTRNIILFAIAQLGSAGLLSIIGWIYIVYKNKLIKAYHQKEIDYECRNYGLKLIFADLFNVTASKISYFIIGPIFGFASLAVYSVASNLKERIANLIKSTIPNLLYADFAQDEREKLIQVVGPKLKIINLISLVIMIIFIGLGYFYIKLFLPLDYQYAINYYIILALVFPSTISALVLQTILEAHLRYKEITVVYIIPQVLTIILILILGFIFSVTGVCVAITLGGWLNLGFRYLLVMRQDLVFKLIEKFPLLKKASNRF